ncbi:hypothetical protein [Aliiroseovarius sp.]|uniref:hypothetical protein n=1 Tax=Aliiroseovarius sp. TaxID=1872442 RepID=UPI0026353BB7|nr:hypothetical protein [Aliiroseovarius sp.]
MILRGLTTVLFLVFASVQMLAAQGIVPAVPKATGEPHPEGNDFMRRWHMTMMEHDRDETMYQGVRPVGASLSACFDCHTVTDDLGKPVTFADDRHFCRTCHEFAAVRIDCFECHRSTPEGFDELSAQAAQLPSPNGSLRHDETLAALRAYLEVPPVEERR